MGDDPTRDQLRILVQSMDQLLTTADQVVVGTVSAAFPAAVPVVVPWWRTECVRPCRALIAELRRDVEALGDTWTLRGAAEQWQLAATAISEVQLLVDPTELASDDVFSGQGAEAYRASIGPQQAAMQALLVRDLERLTGGLNTTARTIDGFAQQCIQIYTDYLIDVGFWLAMFPFRTATIVGIIPELIDLVVMHLDLYSTYGPLLADTLTTLLGVGDGWYDAITNHDGLPGGAWPKVSPDM